jgi:hypothetical protein
MSGDLIWLSSCQGLQSPIDMCPVLPEVGDTISEQ